MDAVTRVAQPASPAMVRGGEVGLGLGLLGAAAVATIAALNFPGERLYIDDVLVDRGRIGFAVTLRGTIESGAGAGERVTAEVKGTFLRVSCRIVAEAFS